MKIFNLRKNKRTMGADGTMDGAVMKIGQILQEKGLDEGGQEIVQIMESDVVCSKCSGRFTLKDGWTEAKDTLVKVTCPYCKCDAAIRME